MTQLIITVQGRSSYKDTIITNRNFKRDIYIYRFPTDLEKLEKS